jgi:hypothetical protein
MRTLAHKARGPLDAPLIAAALLVVACGGRSTKSEGASGAVGPRVIKASAQLRAPEAR